MDDFIKQDLPFREKLANFWYYYKWHTLLALFIAAVLAIGCTQCAMRVKPDYKIVLALSTTVTDEICDTVEKHFEAFGVDLNADGRVSVDVIDVCAGGGRDAAAAQSTKLMGEMWSGQTMLYITDEDFYNRLMEYEVFEAVDWLPDLGGTAYNWRDTALADQINAVFPDYISHDVFISKRVVKGTDRENDKKLLKIESESIDLLKKAVKSWEK